MSDSEHRHVDDHIAEPVEEEDHSDQKQDVIDPGDHVLGTEIEEREWRRPVDLRHCGAIRFGDVVGEGGGGLQKEQDQ
jgi:hypothetical protein